MKNLIQHYRIILLSCTILNTSSMLNGCPCADPAHGQDAPFFAEESNSLQDIQENT